MDQNRQTNFAQQQQAVRRSVIVAPGWINAGSSMNNGYNRDFATQQEQPRYWAHGPRTDGNVFGQCKKCKNAEE